MIGTALSIVITLAIIGPVTLIVMGEDFLDEHGQEMFFLLIIGIASIRADVILVHIDRQLSDFLESRAIRKIPQRRKTFVNQAHKGKHLP